MLYLTLQRFGLYSSSLCTYDFVTLAHTELDDRTTA